MIAYLLAREELNMLNQWLYMLSDHQNMLRIALLITISIFWLIIFIQIKLRPSIKREMKRIAKGKPAKEQKRLSDKQIQKALSKIKSSATTNGTIIGVNQYTSKPVIFKDEDANLHTLAVGTTGSGKTTALANFVESAIVRKWPLFYVDGKGDYEFAKRIERFAKSQGVPFYLFSMVGDSCKYNPISFGGFTSKKDRIIELREWSEDHYRKIAEGYLQTVFYTLEKANVSVNLHTLSKYLETDALLDLARTIKGENLVDRISKLADKRKDIESLIAEIQNIAHSEIGHLFDCTDDNNTLTLSKALKEKSVVYFCLQPLAFPAYASTLGKLVINDLKSLVASQLKQQTKTNMLTIFDEFSVFAGDQVINLINQGRGAGVHAILATQSLSDIEIKGGKALLGQVLNNCNNYITQRQNNPTDAEILANIMGTKDDFIITSQIANKGSTGAGSVRKTKQFVVHPDKIKCLKQGEAFVTNKQPNRSYKILVKPPRSGL